MKLNKLFVLLFLLQIQSISLEEYLDYKSPFHPTLSRNGMVLSQNIESSKIRAKICGGGGNAVDAAVAVGFTLAVTCPENGNLGGGGFIIGATANGKIFTQDHREKAPSKSNHDMFLDKNGSVIPYMSLTSRAASGVPGTVHGLLTAWSDHGSGNIRIQQLLSSAIKNSFLVKPSRVWVHTCSLDHKNALKNYISRGMKIFKKETIEVSI